MQKIPKRRGKNGLFIEFLDPRSPRLASGSPGPPKDFKVKLPACLGEPVTSRVSLSSPGTADIAPSSHFPINRHAREVEGGLKVQYLRELRELREKKKKEEKTRPRHCRIATMINLYIVPRSVFFA